MKTTFKAYLDLLKLRIVASVVFASLIGYGLARPENSGWVEVIALIFVSFLCSSASCVFNHVYEAELDSKMDRTHGRPFPSGRLHNKTGVWFFCFFLFASGSAIALVFLNQKVFMHFAFGFITYALVYTVWLKPRTPWSIVWGGAAGSFAVLGGASVGDPQYFMQACMVAIVFFFWTPPHYWSIALRYQDDYKKSGLPILPLVVGEKKTAKMIFISTLLMLLVSIVPFVMDYFGWIYLITALVAAFIFLGGNWTLLHKPLEKGRLNFKLSFVYVFIYFLGSLADVWWQAQQISSVS